jgi:putative transposase
MAMCGIKMRAWPTAHQKQVLSQWMGCARFIYNGKCEEQDYFFKFRCRSLNHTGERIPFDQAYAQFKTEQSPFLKNCPSQILRNSSVIWYKAMQSFFKGITGRPVRKKKGSRASIWLTQELFRLEKVEETGEWRLFIGADRNNIGFLSFTAHREFQMPASITLSKNNGQYFVSFNYEDPKLNPRPAEEILEEIAQESPDKILAQTRGLDRGIKNPLQSSDGLVFDFTPAQKASIEKEQKNIRKGQRRMAKQKIGSRRREKTKAQIARGYQKIGNVRRDFAHKTSRKLADTDARVFVYEDLKIKNMTKAPKPKPSKKNPDHFLPNKAAAKAGLNQKILNSAWGLIALFLKYKASYLDKVVIEVPPHYSSQECAQCSHTHPDNRQTQSEFVCQKCGHAENADLNASKVLRKRGVNRILTEYARGTRVCARGEKSKTRRALLKVRSRRNENQGMRSHGASLILEASRL